MCTPPQPAGSRVDGTFRPASRVSLHSSIANVFDLPQKVTFRRPIVQEQKALEIEKPSSGVFVPIKASIFWATLDLNQRPLACQASALTN